VVPELPGCSAFSETEEAALKEVKIAIELWLGVAEIEGGRYRSHEEKNCSARFTKLQRVRPDHKKRD
jgi:predicted RNase H-like HicB family nuclease